MRRAEIIPIRNIPSKTPAPPIDKSPGPNFLALCKFKISAPIKVPKTPEIKAVGAANSGAKIMAKRTAKSGGIKAEIPIPLPGITLEKILAIKIIKKVAVKTGSNGTLLKK